MFSMNAGSVALLCCLVAVAAEEPVVSHSGWRHTTDTGIDGGEKRYDKPLMWGDKIVFAPEGGVTPQTRQSVVFEVASQETSTLEVVLYVANHWEPRFWLVVGSLDAAETGTESESQAHCHDFTDECGRQRLLTYTTPPLINKHTMFANRIALRIQPRFPGAGSSAMMGKWRVTIANDLPKGVENAFIVLQVEQKKYSYWGFVFTGLACTAVAGLGFVTLWAFILYRMAVVQQRRLTADSRDDGGDDTHHDQQTVNRPVANEALSRVVGLLGGWYRLLEEPQAGEGEGDTGDGGEGEEEEEEDEDRCCRICKCTAPSADLFTPCNCKGSVRFVHRACLEEWRRVTTQEENRIKCSECKAPFTIAIQHTYAPLAYAKSTLAGMGLFLAQLILLEIYFLAAGYAFKVVAGFLTRDMDGIVWEPNAYHHLVAGILGVAFTWHRELLSPVLDVLVPNKIAQVAMILLSLLFEIPAGYFGQLVLWMLNPILWDWQIHYCLGFIVLMVYTVVFHESVRGAYRRLTLNRRLLMDQQAAQQQQRHRTDDRDNEQTENDQEQQSQDRSASPEGPSEAADAALAPAAPASPEDVRIQVSEDGADMPHRNPLAPDHPATRRSPSLD